MQAPFMQVWPEGHPHWLPHMVFGGWQAQVPALVQVWRSGQVPQQSDSWVTQRLEFGHFTSGAQHSPLAMQRPSQARVSGGHTHIREPLQTRPPLQSAFTQQPPAGFTHSHLLVLVLHV